MSDERCRTLFNLTRFNLNLFFALDAILNARNLTEAAKSVHLSQPAMSVALKKLRAYFNDDLVVYSSGETRLTALALALRPRIKMVLQSAREALNLSLEFDPATSDRTLRITSNDVVELIFLRLLFADVAREAPLISMVSTPFTYETVDVVFRNDIDVAIVAEAFADPNYATLPLFTDELCCMVWTGNSRIGDAMSEGDYFSMRHAAMHRSPDRLSHPVGVALSQLSNKIDIAVYASVYSSLPHMMIGTDLVVTTLRRFAEFCATTLPVRVLPVPVETPKMRFVAQWQPYRDDEPVIQWLVSRLKHVAAQFNEPAAR